jgi:hypothetical protein
MKHRVVDLTTLSVKNASTAMFHFYFAGKDGGFVAQQQQINSSRTPPG